MKLLHYNSQSVDHANISKHESVHVFNALALSCFTFDYFNPCQQVIRHRMTTLPAGLSHAYNYTHSLSLKTTGIQEIILNQIQDNRFKLNVILKEDIVICKMILYATNP